MPSAGAATLAVARRDLGVQVTFRSMTRELVTADLADAWPERFESLPPVRVPRAFKGQRNFAGSWWFATTQSHVAFESWLERDHLMLLDFAPEVVAVAAQPFTAVLPTSSGPRKHTPDFFVRTGDGTGVVIDVRPDSRAAKDADVFEATAAVCVCPRWLGLPAAGRHNSPVRRERALALWLSTHAVPQRQLRRWAPAGRQDRRPNGRHAGQGRGRPRRSPALLVPPVVGSPTRCRSTQQALDYGLARATSAPMTRAGTVRVGDRVRFDGQAWDVGGLDAGTVYLTAQGRTYSTSGTISGPAATRS